MIRMFLIRHGQSTYNSAKESLQELEAGPGTGGATPCDVDPALHDAALSEKGRQQALAVVAPPVDVILVSPLTRAIQTAMILYPSRHNEFVIVPGASEFLCATCDIGRPVSTLLKEFPSVCALSGLDDMWWAGDSPSHASVDAFRENTVTERIETFSNRLRKIMSECITPLPDSVKSVALVAHHDTIAHFASLHFGGVPGDFHLQNCEVIEFAFDRTTLIKI